MVAFGNRLLGDLRRRPLNMMGDVFFKSEWMETSTDPLFAPTVFLAEQPPCCELLPHFHRQNQFQLFVQGSGTIGKEQINPVTVHYAGAYTGYGPILSGAQGLKYFTIRAAFDTGLTLATDWRGTMVRGPKCHAQASVGEPWPLERLSMLQATQHDIAVAPSEGLGVELSRLPPHATVTLPPIQDSVGQFIFVLAGSARLMSVSMAPWESAFVPYSDGAALVTAGEYGAQIIALHMPHTAPEYLPR